MFSHITHHITSFPPSFIIGEKMNDISELVKYEVPILRHIIKNYEAMGYSHNSAEQHAVEFYSQELRNAYEMGISPEVEELIIQERWKFDRVLEQKRWSR